MPLRYMLDTNIVSYVLRARDPKLAARVIRSEDLVCTSSVVLAELHYGAELSGKREHNLGQIADLVAVLPVLDFDSDAAEHYGQIRAALKRAGQPIGALDPMIAGHARSRGLTLVTNNERHFSRIAGLAIENWAN